MNIKNLVVIGCVGVLCSCATQEVKQKTPEGRGIEFSKNEPSAVILKGNQPLELVRVMDGGVCKNTQQGAQGEFLVYADQIDIERIKREQGEKMFSNFEQKIEHFASLAFEKAVHDFDFTQLANGDAQRKMSEKLAENFKVAVAEPVNQFQQETTLTLDVVAFPSAIIFYTKGCNTSEMSFPG